MPSIGGVSWSVGWWKTELLDVSLHSRPTSTDNKWGWAIWTEENTEDTTKAYVKIDILDSTGDTILSDVDVEDVGYGRKGVNISLYTICASVDIYLKFRLFGLSKSPIISKFEVQSANS